MKKQKKMSEREQGIMWKPDYCTIEIKSETADLSHILENKMEIIPYLYLAQRNTKNAEEYFYFKALGMDYKKITQRQAILEYHSSYFLKNDFTKLIKINERLINWNLITEITRLDLCTDIKNKRPCELIRSKKDIKFKAITKRYPEDESKELETLYIRCPKWRWKIKIYNKSLEAKKKFKTFNEYKQQETQKFLEEQYTRIEITLNRELIRQTYLTAIRFEDWSGIIEHFFSRKKFNGELEEILTGKLNKYKREQDIKAYKHSEINLNSLKNYLIRMSLNLNNKGLNELKALINDESVVKEVLEARERIIKENRDYEERIEKEFGTNS